MRYNRKRLYAFRAITSHSSHIHRLRLWKLDGKAYTNKGLHKQRPTQTKAYTRQKPTQSKSQDKNKATATHSVAVTATRHRDTKFLSACDAMINHRGTRHPVTWRGQSTEMVGQNERGVIDAISVETFRARNPISYLFRQFIYILCSTILIK